MRRQALATCFPDGGDRGPKTCASLIHHTDRGEQFVSSHAGNPSISSRGTTISNADIRGMATSAQWNLRIHIGFQLRHSPLRPLSGKWGNCSHWQTPTIGWTRAPKSMSDTKCVALELLGTAYSSEPDGPRSIAPKDVATYNE